MSHDAGWRGPQQSEHPTTTTLASLKHEYFKKDSEGDVIQSEETCHLD